MTTTRMMTATNNAFAGEPSKKATMKPNGMNWRPRWVIPAGIVLFPTIAAMAGDGWLQYGGPNRDFVCAAKGLSEDWPKSGPRKLWERELGEGYSAVLCDGPSLYTMYSIRKQGDDGKFVLDGEEVVVALDAKTGKTLWECRYPAPLSKNLDMEFGPGPHSTPLLVGDRLITVGVTAKMHCLDKRTGSVIWSHDLLQEYNAELGGRGFAPSPIDYQGTIILPIGGKAESPPEEKKGKADSKKEAEETESDPDRSIIAFNLKDGSVAWKRQAFDGAAASLVIMKVADDKKETEDQLIAFMGKEVAGLNPSNGDLLWRQPHETMYGANISTPVCGNDNIIFVSSAYGMGSRGVQLTRKGGKTTARELWFNPKLQIHHGNAVRVGDYVYGSDGSFGPSFFVAMNVKTGKIAWKERGIAKSTCLYADEKLIILDEDGRLLLAAADQEGIDILSKSQLLERAAWTVPTLVGKRLYLRDRKHMMALDLG